MYESPIEIIVGKMQMQMDDDIVRAVQAYHINVNKDELVKALRYDRDQYEKGYAEGKYDAERMHGKWMPYNALFSDTLCCSECEFNVLPEEAEVYRFCPNCGADMRGEKDD